MPKHIYIDQKISSFNKTIKVTSDKSLSIRTILLASQAVGTSKISNLLESEDVLNALKVIKKLGIGYKKKKNCYEIYGFGLNGFSPINNTVINAGNSGTLGRLILSLLIKSKKKIKLIGDQSLSKRDFSRVTEPLKKFGASFKSNKKRLPIFVKGTNNPKPIKYFENIGSAQCKSSIMLAALNTPGTTHLKAKKSRDHTELLFKHLKIPIKIKKTKKFDLINIKNSKDFNFFNYNTNTHRHICEIRQELKKNTKSSEVLFSFNPHVLPNFRGMMSTIYCDLLPGINKSDVINCFNDMSNKNQFINFIQNDQRADFFSIQNTNNCILKIFDHYDSSKIIIVSLIDNLIKGAAGQAVQCFNLSQGFDESSALTK